MIAETERRRVVGRVHTALLTRLTDPLPIAGLVRSLSERFATNEVLAAFRELVQAGLVVDRRHDAGLADAGSATFLPRSSDVMTLVRSEGGPRDSWRATIPSLACCLRWISPPHSASVSHALEACGIAVRQEAPTVIVIVRDYLEPQLWEAADEIDSQGRVCIPFKPYGRLAWLGPTLGRNGVCPSCLLHRLQVNRPIETYLRGEGWPADAVLPKATFNERALSAASVFAGVELARRAQDNAASGALILSSLLTFDPEQRAQHEHSINPRPQCPRCGTPALFAERMERPIVLQSRPKAKTDDGGHRIESPEATYQRLACHVDAFVGAVSSLGELSSKSCEHFPVFAASHFLRPPAGTATADERFHQISIGKGKAAAQARTSALCEALERQCARFQGDEPKVRGSYLDLAPAAIDPRQLLLFSERQYAVGTPAGVRARWRTLGTPRSQAVPLPFDPSKAIEWTPVWSLTHGARRYVPFAYVFGGAPQPVSERVCSWDSNGCAAGNCLEEAILQALLELIERDATAIWWYNRIPRTGVDLATFGQPYFLQVQQRYAQAGYDLWVLDLTHDLGIPVAIALAAETRGERYAAGLGCHLDPTTAVQRALTELHQVFDPKRLHPPLFTRSEVGDDFFLRPAENASRRTIESHPNCSSDDLRVDLDFCLERLNAAGLELLVADYSRPDVALSTVKVMVPGMRHFWPRLAPGRLYDVPVNLGWLAQPLTELELNPLPLLM